MKNIILIICLLIVNLSFSQKDSKPFLKKVFYNHVEEKQQQTNAFNFFGLQGLEKLKLLKSIKPTNNSEGKFPFYNNNKQLLDLELAVNKEIAAEEMMVGEQIKKKTIFVDKVVLKILKDNNIESEEYINRVDFQRGRTSHFSENYTLDVNKLTFVYQFKNEVEFKIGKDLYAYLSKIYKSELDKTLLNSLNLFVMNF
jgi:predicted PilT family ATPase